MRRLLKRQRQFLAMICVSVLGYAILLLSVRYIVMATAITGVILLLLRPWQPQRLMHGWKASLTAARVRSNVVGEIGGCRDKYSSSLRAAGGLNEVLLVESRHSSIVLPLMPLDQVERDGPTHISFTLDGAARDLWFAPKSQPQSSARNESFAIYRGKGRQRLLFYGPSEVALLQAGSYKRVNNELSDDVVVVALSMTWMAG